MVQDLLQCVTRTGGGGGGRGGYKNGEFGCYVIIELPIFLYLLGQILQELNF